MATSFPGAIDTTNLTNPATTDKTNSPSHAGLHANANDAIKAVETKLGTGSSTPATSTLLFGTGAGTSAWQTLTSANLAAALTDETGTGSAVFATTPTLVTPKVDTINENTPGNGVTVAGLNIKSGAITTTNSIVTANITNAAVTAAKLQYGLVRQRQGGTSGDAAWNTSGTTNTDTSSKAAFIQAGCSVGSASADVTITFPSPYSQVPVVIAVNGGAASANSWTELITTTTTTFTFRCIDAGGALRAEKINWIAIGQ